jgi:hypothetical protein
VVRSSIVQNKELSQAAAQSLFSDLHAEDAIDSRYAEILMQLGSVHKLSQHHLLCKRRLDVWVECFRLLSQYAGMLTREYSVSPFLLLATERRKIFPNTHNDATFSTMLQATCVSVEGEHLEIVALCCTGRNIPVTAAIARALHTD